VNDEREPNTSPARVTLVLFRTRAPILCSAPLGSPRARLRKSTSVIRPQLMSILRSGNGRNANLECNKCSSVYAAVDTHHVFSSDAAWLFDTGRHVD
jgi:hypothetical protein